MTLDLRPSHPFVVLLRERPYLAEGSITRTDASIEVLYHYAVVEERTAIAAAQALEGPPPLRWVRGWVDDWERHLREAVREPTSDAQGRPHLTITGLLHEHRVVVRAIPDPKRGTRVPHALMDELVAIRLAQGLSQAEAARRTGYGNATLWRWEHGARVPTLEQADDYAQFLGHRLTLVPITESQEATDA